VNDRLARSVAPGEGSDATASLAGGAIRAFADHLAVGADRPDHITVSVEQPGDPEVLLGRPVNADCLAHAQQSWGPHRT